MAKEKTKKTSTEFVVTTEWVFYLLFLVGLALLYIYLVHRIDNIVRDIESTKKNLIELRAENITLKSELMKNRSRQNLEERLATKGVKEPNRAVKVIELGND